MRSYREKQRAVTSECLPGTPGIALPVTIARRLRPTSRTMPGRQAYLALVQCGLVKADLAVRDREAAFCH